MARSSNSSQGMAQAAAQSVVLAQELLKDNTTATQANSTRIQAKSLLQCSELKHKPTGKRKKGVQRRMGPNLTYLREELENRVQHRTGRRVRNLSIQVNPDSIILQGQTVSYYVKQLAQHGVRECLPDVCLVNAITVAH
jgi:hypothetical protein